MKKLNRKTKKPKRPKSEWSVVPLEGSGGQGPYPPDDSELQRRIKTNPLGVAAEAKYKLGEVKAGYRRELYAVLAMTVGIGRHYYNDFSSWKTFFEQSFFQAGKQKPKARAHQLDALRHTMNYVFDAKSKQARSRTGKYAAALHEIMITGVPVHLVAAKIEEAGGIERLYDAYLEREAHKPKKGGKQIMDEADHAFVEQLCNPDDKRAKATEDMTLGDLDDNPMPTDGGTWDGDDGEAEDGLDISDDAEFGVDSTVERGRDPAGRRTIEFEVTSARQSRFFHMADGQDAMIHVTCLGTDGEWQRLRVRKVIWNRR